MKWLRLRMLRIHTLIMYHFQALIKGNVQKYSITGFLLPCHACFYGMTGVLLALELTQIQLNDLLKRFLNEIHQ